MSRVQPDFGENPDFNPQNPEQAGDSGVERIDDTLGESSPESVPTPDSAESIPPVPENAPVAAIEIEPATLSELEAKFGQQKWEKGEQFASDWHLDLNTREVFNSKGESQTQLFQSSAEHSAKHQAMIDELISNGTHYLEPHQTDKEFIVTIVRLQADGKITFETFKHAIEPEVKPEEPASTDENMEDGDDDEEVAPVAVGYSAPTFSFSPEKIATTPEIAPENQPASVPALNEVRASQPVVVAETKSPAFAQESFFQKVMRESRATVVPSSPAERRVEKVVDVTDPVSAEIKEVVEVEKNALGTTVEQIKVPASLPEVAKEKKEVVKIAATSFVEKTEQVEFTQEIPLFAEVPASVEKKVDTKVPIVEVLHKPVVLEVKKDLKIESKNELEEQVVAEPVIGEARSVSEINLDIKSAPVELEKVEPTYEEVVAMETGISLEPENTTPEVFEVPKIIEHPASVIEAPQVEALAVVSKKEQVIGRARHQEMQTPEEVQAPADDTGIELIEFDHEPINEGVPVVAEEPIQLVVTKPAAIERENESAQAIDTGIELVEVAVAEPTMEIAKPTQVVAESGVSNHVEAKAETPQEAAETTVIARDKIVEKPDVQEVVIKNVAVELRDTVKETAQTVSVEKTEVPKKEPVKKAELTSVVEKIVQSEIVLKSEIKKAEPDMLRKNIKSDKVEVVTADDDHAAMKAPVESTIDSVNTKNNQELITKRYPSTTVVVSEDEENERVKQERELETFEVAFA